MADDKDPSPEFGTVLIGNASQVKLMKVKAKKAGVVNGSNGWIIVFDPDHEDEKGRYPTIDPADYQRFLAEGYIDDSDDGDKPEAAATGADRPFVPAGAPRAFTAEDLEAMGVPQVFLDRLLASGDAEDSVDVTTGLSTRAMTAFPQDVGHPIENGSIEGDDAPPAPKRGPGRPRSTPAPAAPPAPVLDGDGKPVEPAAS